VHAASTQPCKSWPRARWRELARGLARDGYGIIEVGRGHAPLGVGADAIGRTDVRTLCRVLAQVDLVVGEDSGPLHLALAVGTAAVGLFGPTDPALLYPPGAPLAAVTTSAGCRSCWPLRVLAYPSGLCPLERHECMEAIAVGAVRAAVGRALLARAAAVSPYSGRGQET
jgi:ADP-heptose:LPS heptosyltransferase